MKKLLTILLILISLNSSAKIGGNTIIVGGVTSVIVFAAYNKNWHSDFDSKNGLYVSPGIDPAMLLEAKLNVRHRISYKYNRFNPYFVWETFSWADYEGYTCGLDYCLIDRKLSFLLGYETGIINNQSKKVWTNGINAEVKLWCKNNYSISYIGNVKTRPAISKDVVYSGYLHLNIKL